MVLGDIPRRKFIAASAAGITAIWLGAKWLDLERAGTDAARSAIDPTYRFQTFTATQAADIEAFAGQIIPSEDGSPGARVIHDFYELDPKLGIAGGGGIDFRFDFYPISFALQGLPMDAPKWGRVYKQMLKDYYTRSLYALGHTTSLPAESNSISLDPAVKDDWGLPAIRVTFKDHPNDVKLAHFFLERAIQLLGAAGATRMWPYPVDEVYLPAANLLGTCRMGNDPRTSVVDAHHRAHDVPNLILVDGSSFVTSGRGQPTMTIQALAFRAAEHVGAMAKGGGL
jgi:hypothetical protein